MERTVGSFKSFIRTVPPNPNIWSDISPLSPSDQTLPPLFLPPKPKPTDSAVHVTSWRAPSGWNLSPPGQSPPINPVSSARKYSPLIPEPSPSLCSSRTGSECWPLEARALQSPRLQPTHQSVECEPEPPPHNWTRSPPFQTPSFEKPPKPLLSPIGTDPFGCSLPNVKATHLVSDSPLESGQQDCSIPSADTVYKISDASRRAKAYISLGIMWPGDTRTGWQYWSAAPHVDSITETSRSLQRKKLPPLYRASPLVDEECEDEQLSDRLQLLSFSQDYHDVLADQYHQCKIRRPQSSSVSIASSGLVLCGCIPIPRFRPKTREMIPEPLTWSKGSGRRMKHKESTLWTPLRQFGQDSQRPSLDGNLPPRSVGEYTIQNRKRIPSTISQAKGSRANKPRTGSMETATAAKPSHISRGMASDSPSQGYRSLLIRLPRGLALVRLSRATASHSETTDSYDTTIWEDRRQKSSAVSDYPWRRSSFYNSSPPSSPFPYDIPPPLPVSPATITGSLPVCPPSHTSEVWIEEKISDVPPDDEIGSRSPLDKARNVRDAWRRHRREAKHDRIKQSIKVLGLTDPTVAAGYTKSWGIRSGDDHRIKVES